MTFAYNIIANYLGRLFTIAAGYIVIPFYIAYVGEAGFGVISFYTIILTFGALMDAGFTPTFTREVARAPTGEHLPRLLASMEAILLVALGLAAWLVIALAGPIAESWLGSSSQVGADEIERSVMLMGLCLVPQLMSPLYTAALLGLQRQVIANGLLVFATSLRSFAVLPVLAASPSLETFFLWQIAANLIVLLVTRSVALALLGKRPIFFAKPDFRLFLPVWQFSAGMLAIQAVASVNTQLDKLVVSKLFSVEDLGFYTIASTLGLVPYAMVIPILIAALPRMTGFFESKNFRDLQKSYLMLTAIVGALAAFSSAGIAFYTDEIFSLWLPDVDLPQYAGLLAQLLVSGGFFLAVGSVAFYVGLACGHNQTSVMIGIVTLILSPPTMAIGASIWGITAVAIPWLIFNILNFLVLSIRVVGPRVGSRSVWLALATIALIGAAGLCTTALGQRIAASLDFGALATPFLGCALAAVMIGALWLLFSRLGAAASAKFNLVEVPDVMAPSSHAAPSSAQPESQ